MKLTDLVSREQLLEGLHAQEDDDDPADYRGLERDFRKYSLNMNEFCLAILFPGDCETLITHTEATDAAHRLESNISISEWVRFREFLIHLDYFSEGDYYEITMPELTTDTENAFLDTIIDSITVYHISDMHLVLSKLKTFDDMVAVVKNVGGDNWKSVLYNYIDSID